MTRSTLNTLVLASVVLLVGASAATADMASARLRGFDEVPSVSSPAGGRFEATIRNTSITFRLDYFGLVGNVSAAHIHFAQPGVNGGVMLFLCGGGGMPACPGPHGGTVKATVVAAQVIGPAGQGIAAGEFAEVLRAIRAGYTYVNVHTDTFPSGEIRGQLRFDP
jgi:hypothetical protein